jgi:hypothetical protein
VFSEASVLERSIKRCLMCDVGVTAAIALPLTLPPLLLTQLTIPFPQVHAPSHVSPCRNPPNQSVRCERPPCHVALRQCLCLAWFLTSLVDAKRWEKSGHGSSRCGVSLANGCRADANPLAATLPIDFPSIIIIHCATKDLSLF